MSKIIARITADPIRFEALAAELAVPQHGAQALFVGLVRDENDGRKVAAVSYDVHPPLAEKTFREIAEEALARFGADLRVAIVHRFGRLAVGEASVAICVGSAHRDEALQACRYAIEQIKVRSPIWKQEHYLDGDSEWLAGHSLRPHIP
ncbi:MAG TPA: molybdenum cofactor biosynthesis protein MoaE [Anaeromyxobacteraceae bacterium]|nr:molybdenum cofactor biosynthesis protein MoaE [Anaeromyxobacteraceae bacterium]